ncbi:MAG TPA: DUF616 domain-containing protein [Acholeplasmataceae bacterium]|nr:DUF616 domain-containing protein [Acholeplasmataceae bacterium]
MFIGSVDKTEYEMQMDNISRLLGLYYSTINSDTYKLGARIISHKKKIFNLFDEIKLRRRIKSKPVCNHSFEKPNYFHSEKIAVYTCVFGKYDIIEEPYCKPNNVDYYVITDQEVPSNSLWKKIDIKEYDNELKGMSNVEKNRWFKMFPHKFLKNYKYSVYVDGNVVPVTDFTEFINRIKFPGVAMFRHSANDCVYKEALFNKYRIKKTPSKEIDIQVEFLKKQGMPENYGMTTCNVIARDHNNELCLQLMEDWWNEFITRCRRDQMSFTYVAWKNNVKIEDIAQLGPDVWEASSLYIKRHI